MDISEERQDGVVIVRVTGRLDASNVTALQEKLFACLDAGDRRIVLDGRRLDYIDSTGVRVILVAAKRLKPGGGEIVIAALSDYVNEVFTIAGLTTLFRFYASVEEAVAALR